MKISTNTKAQLGAGGNYVLGYSLKQNESRAVHLQFSDNDLPQDITNFTFTAVAVKRDYAYAVISKNDELDVQVLAAIPNTPEIVIPTGVTDAAAGKVYFYLPPTLTVEAPALGESPIIYTGYLMANDNASQLGMVAKILFVVAIVNDGV